MSVVEQQVDLKQLMKEAVKEALAENSEMLKELIAESIEDIAFLQRMEEGRKTPLVSRKKIMKILESKS